jgi:hypothetical protein
MKSSKQMEEIALSVNKFLSNSKRKIECKFKDGFYLNISKRIIKGLPYLEIHTSGYDDTLPLTDAITWIKWELIDMEANGLLKLEKIG